MKLSLNWLNKFLILDDISAEEVAKKLTLCSFEVEEVHKVGPKLKGPIVVGKILKVEKHPNADRLSVLRVTTDGRNAIQIVCGAGNVKEGQKVPVSLPGSCVVNRTDGTEFFIKTTKIREVDSYGMLCAPQEVGIQSGDLNSILILGDDAEVGKSVIDYLSLCQDTVLEVSPRSNRGDALSVYGLAREISALSGKKFREIDFKVPDFDNSVKSIRTVIENINDTTLFYGVTIEQISVFDSPQWLRNLLESVDIRSINNIVDITNYVNITFGQPLHAYDREKLKGDVLTSRLARNGEKICTLDGKTRVLNEEVLVIADKTRPVALAGIMGGIDSEVTKDTSCIVLEAAVFNPKRIRKGSRGCGLATEASKRFERGVDSNFTYNALLYTVGLIKELASLGSGKIKIGGIQQAGTPNKIGNKIKLEKGEVKRVLGVDLELDEIGALLNSLQFVTRKITDNSVEVMVPTHRASDVTRQIDLIEEIARLYGYDRILPVPPQLTICGGKRNQAIDLIKNHFLASGFSEVYLSSLIGESLLSNKDFPYDEHIAVSMINPLSKEHSTLRQSLIPGLVEALRLNLSHKITPVRLFEIGKVYYNFDESMRNEKDTGAREELKIAGLCFGSEEYWLGLDNEDNKTGLFYKVKGVLESLFTRFEKANSNVLFLPYSENYMHSSLALKINLNEKNIGVAGCLHPSLEKKLEITGETVIFEISLEDLLLELQKPKMYEKISSQPVLVRDITVDLPQNIISFDITKEINRIKSDFVINVSLTKVYEPDKETKSLTFRLKMQDFGQTLTGKQVEDELNRIKTHLSACFQAKFRV